jgi:hypothetical protein
MNETEVHEALLKKLEELGGDGPWDVTIRDGMVHARGALVFQGEKFELNGMEFLSLLTTTQACEDFAMRIAEGFMLDRARYHLGVIINEDGLGSHNVSGVNLV